MCGWTRTKKRIRRFKTQYFSFVVHALVFEGICFFAGEERRMMMMYFYFFCFSFLYK